jgi:VanZ family protein
LNLFPPLLASAAVVLSAPFIGRITTAIARTFPDQYVRIVGASVAAGLAVALAAGILRVSRAPAHRGRRAGALAAAIVLAAVYAFVMRTGDAAVDAVERVHFLEYGAIAFLFYRAWRPSGDVRMIGMPVLAGLLVGTLEEWYQWVIPARVGEIRDVFLNLFAVACGVIFSVGASPPSSFTPAVGAARVPLLRFAALVLIVFAAFVDAVHLGYQIEDGEGGSFRSHYASAELDALVRDRTERWRTAPPLVMRPLSREDQYLSEGHSHVGRRNERWGAGDALGAWHENLILERFYRPVLDTPSYVSRSGHRWSAEQWADAERRARSARDAPYVSEALPMAIVIWPKSIYWTVVLAVALAMVSATTPIFPRRAWPRTATGNSRARPAPRG